MILGILYAEWLALGASFAYALTILVLAEVMRVACAVRKSVTRKTVHILAGMWVLPMLFMFSRWYIGIIPFATFIFVNSALFATGCVPSIADGTPGIVYFAAAITLLFGLLWGPSISSTSTLIALCAVMALTWGDGLAALIGEACGRRVYRINGATRSVEGSIAMFFGTVTSTLIVLSLILTPLVALGMLWDLALLGVVAAAVEAVTPRGMDNLTVPLASAALLYAMWM